MSFEIMIGLDVTSDDEYQRYRDGMVPILESFVNADLKLTHFGLKTPIQF